jgi:hypothetical protein
MINKNQASKILNMTDTEAGLILKKLCKKKLGLSVSNLTEFEESLIKSKSNKVKEPSEQAKIIYKDLIGFFEDNQKPKTEMIYRKWLLEIDKILQIDKVPPRVIIGIVEKARKDPFWSKNFQSILKLRKNNSDGVKYIVYFYNYFKKKSNVTSSFKNEILKKLQS